MGPSEINTEPPHGLSNPNRVRCYEWLGSRRSWLRWLTTLIQKLWDWDMWDNCNRVLHETKQTVARDLQIRQVTAEFDMSPAGLALAARSIFEEDYRLSFDSNRLIKRHR
jgi:hypothetical protein